jgi:tetratricopeptide (TPR) repeat protein
MLAIAHLSRETLAETVRATNDEQAGSTGSVDIAAPACERAGTGWARAGEEDVMDDLWDRVRSGRHAAVVGLAPGEPSPASGASAMRVVRVRCDGPPTTLGPLHDARRRIDAVLGHPPARFEEVRDRMVSGLRRRLLGEEPAFEAEGALVAAYNRLAQASEKPAALVFEAVDAADDATLTALRRILGRPGWLKLPLVLGFREPDLAKYTGAAAALLGVVRATCGDDAILRHAPPAPASELAEPAQGEAAGSPSPAAARDHAALVRTLSPEVVRVLRAGAIVGSGFEADLVAALLGLDGLVVLDLVQRAADAGVPVEDTGEGRMYLPEPLLDALRASTLPSLMTAWHLRLAELLGGFEAEPEAAPAPAKPAPPSGEISPLADTLSGARSVLPREVMEKLVAAARARAAAPPPSEVPEEDDAGRPAPGAWPYAELFTREAANGTPPEAPTEAAKARPEKAATREPAPMPAPAPAARASRVEAPSAPAAPPRVPGPGGGPAPAPRSDVARAAVHAQAAGDLDASAERYFAAARQAIGHGGFAQALVFAENAIAVLDRLPISPKRRRLRARVLAELARLRFQTAGPETEFTLAGAVELLEQAQRSLGDDDPPDLRAEIAALIAAVCYDVGDLGSLTRALDELAAASRLLLAAGDPIGAARLLNDQAAVYVRLGDPVRATHLLGESRRIFEERAAADPSAAFEMAETDHLFARIPLHVAARPGRESDALSMGLDHALAAERTYRRLDAKRELGRVWETMGRLELRKGRLDRAEARLTAAVEVEESLGDLVGLARSTAALSELLAATGRHGDALAVLGDSIALNHEKGSPIGLAFNRRALAALAARAAASPGEEAAVAEVAQQLEEAEATLGRVALAGERDA